MTEMNRTLFARIGSRGIAFALALALVGVNASVVRADPHDPSCGPESPSGPGQPPTKEEKEAERKKRKEERDAKRKAEREAREAARKAEQEKREAERAKKKAEKEAEDAKKKAQKEAEAAKKEAERKKREEAQKHKGRPG